MGSLENSKTMKREKGNEKPNLELFIGKVLRWGVTLACTVAVVGGAFYLLADGGAPMPDYSTFHHEPASYITLRGIWEGVLQFQAAELIQFAVVVLILTPIFRVFLSLVGFLLERDWLYVVIAAVVLGIIIINTLEGA